MNDHTNRAMPRRPWRLATRLLLGCLPALCLLLLAEVVVRVTGVAERCSGYPTSILWVCDPILYFKSNPAQIIHGQHLNAEGFRGHEFGAHRAGVYQIVSLGDSCTFGVISPGERDGLEYIREPYPQHLDRLLSERSGTGRFEVLNAGVPGYNSFQGLMLLRSKLRRLRPDLITVRFGWNDHLMSPGDTDSAFHEPQSVVVRDAQDLLLQTELYPFAKRLGMIVGGRLAAGTAPKERPHTWRPDIPIEAYTHNLERIVEIARARGAAVWFLTAPQGALNDAALRRYEETSQTSAVHSLLEFNALPSVAEVVRIHAVYNAAVREVGARLGVPVVDMDAEYRGHLEEPINQPLFTFNDLVHPTDAGHALEAEVLYRRLEAQGVIPPGSPPTS